MEGFKLILIVVSLLNFIPGSLSKPEPLEIPFYVRDVMSGNNQTVYSVAQASITDQLPSEFGRVYVYDSPATYGPEIESRQMGRLQGSAVLSDFNEKALAVSVNMVFKEGKYNGSTLNIFGRDPLQEKVREVSIVGGSGAFRMARGYIFITTYAVEDAGNSTVYAFRAIVYRNSHPGPI